jgi:hypothetical protein
MFKRAGMGVLALSLIFGAALTSAPAQEKTQNKAKTTVAAKTVEGELVSLDVKKLTAVVKTDSGNQTVSLGKEIKVVGPRDGVRKDGLDDDDLDPGAKVRFTIAANNKTATQLKILAAAPNPPARTTAPGVTKSTTEKKSTTVTKGGSTKSTKGTATRRTEIKGPSGKIVKVDVAAKSFTIVDETGKRTDFTFDSDTQFFGPRGGQGDKNGKDDRFVVGAPVHLVLGASSKAVKEVHLPFRSAIGK